MSLGTQFVQACQETQHHCEFGCGVVKYHWGHCWHKDTSEQVTKKCSSIVQFTGVLENGCEVLLKGIRAKDSPTLL